MKPWEEYAAAQAPQADAEPKPWEEYQRAGRSTGEEALRQVGLTARAGIKGTVGLLAIPGDLLGFKSSQALDNVMSMAGLPSPETTQERVVQDMTGAMAGSGGIAKALPKLAGDVLPSVVSAAGGAGAAGIARESGLPPWAQVIAGMGGGIAAPVGADFLAKALQSGYQGVKGLIAPLTQAGRERIVGDVVKRSASSGAGAAAKMDSPEIVPDSVPTSAQAGQDPGLLALEKNLRNAEPAKFAQREIEQNAARINHLASIAKTPEEIAAATAARDQWAGQALQNVFGAKQPVDTTGVVRMGNAMLDAGARYRGEAGSTLKRFVDDIAEIRDPEVLYNGPRKAIGDVLDGRMAGDSPLKVFSRRELTALRSELDKVIEQGAPGFRRYLDTYRGLSRPIDRWQRLNELRAGSTNAIADVTGQDRLSAANFARQSANVLDDLSPAQRSVVESVDADMQRAAQSYTATKAAGSDTAQNLIGNYVTRQALGAQPSGFLSGMFAKPLTLAYRATGHEDAVKDLLTQAMLDPELARRLLLAPSRPGVNWSGPVRRIPGELLGGMYGTAEATN